MRMLELFSGTKSVSRVFESQGWECVSLDLKNASIETNILDWNYKLFSPPGYFDFVWASPPCTEYSIAKSTGVRKIDEANKIVLKTLEIIDYFKPKHWVIENPQTGYLKKQVFMLGLGFVDVDYCKYGFDYRKRTRLWNNVRNFVPRALCCRGFGYCKGFANGKHKKQAQKEFCTVKELYRIPGGLIEELLASVGMHEA